MAHLKISLTTATLQLCKQECSLCLECLLSVYLLQFLSKTHLFLGNHMYDISNYNITVIPSCWSTSKSLLSDNFCSIQFLHFKLFASKQDEL